MDAWRVAAVLLIASFSWSLVAATSTILMPTTGMASINTTTPDATAATTATTDGINTTATQIMETSPPTTATIANSSTSNDTTNATTPTTVGTNATETESSTSNDTTNATTPTTVTANATETESSTSNDTTGVTTPTTVTTNATEMNSTTDAATPTTLAIYTNSTTMFSSSLESSTDTAVNASVTSTTSNATQTMMNSTTPTAPTDNITTTNPMSTVMTNTTGNSTSSTMSTTTNNTSSSTISSTIMYNVSGNATTSMTSTMAVPNTSTDGRIITNGSDIILSSPTTPMTPASSNVTRTEPSNKTTESAGDLGFLTTPAIIGISIGGAVLLLILFLVIICVCCRRPAKPLSATIREMHSEDFDRGFIALDPINAGLNGDVKNDGGLDGPASLEIKDELVPEKEATENKAPESATATEAATVDHPTPAIDSSAPIEEKENIDSGKDEKKGEDDADKGPNQKNETVDIFAMEPSRPAPLRPIKADVIDPEHATDKTVKPKPKPKPAPVAVPEVDQVNEGDVDQGDKQETPADDKDLPKADLTTNDTAKPKPKPKPKPTPTTIPEVDLTSTDKVNEVDVDQEGKQETPSGSDLPVPADRLSASSTPAPTGAVSSRSLLADIIDPNRTPGNTAKLKPKPKPKPKPTPNPEEDLTTNDKVNEGDVDQEAKQETPVDNKNLPVPAYRPHLSPRRKNTVPSQNSAAGLLANILKPKAP